MIPDARAVLGSEDQRQHGMYEYLAKLSPEGRVYFNETVCFDHISPLTRLRRNGTDGARIPKDDG